MNKLLFFLEKYLAAGIVRLLGITLRYRVTGTFPEERMLFAFWHRNMIPLLNLCRNHQVVILVSTSKDGELIAGPARVLGYRTARGSSRRHGRRGALEMIKLAKKHSLAITPDGPKGPGEKIKPGLVKMAQLTGLPVVFVAADIQREKVFNSWDRFRLPLPFSCVNVTFSAPQIIPPDSEVDQEVEKLQIFFNKLTEQNKIK